MQDRTAVKLLQQFCAEHPAEANRIRDRRLTVLRQVWAGQDYKEQNEKTKAQVSQPIDGSGDERCRSSTIETDAMETKAEKGND